MSMIDALTDEVMSHGTSMFRTSLQEHGFGERHARRVEIVAGSLTRRGHRHTLEASLPSAQTAVAMVGLAMLASGEPLSPVAFALAVLDQIDENVKRLTTIGASASECRLAAAFTALTFLSLVESVRKPAPTAPAAGATS